MLILLAPLVTSIIVATGIFWTAFFILIKDKHIGQVWPLGLLAIMFTFFLIIIFREIRFKWSRIRIKDNSLMIERFFGFGSTEIIDLTQLTGFTRSTEPSRIGSGETINVYSSGVRILEVSDTPYNNVVKIYRQLAKRVKNLGNENFIYTRTITSSLGQPIRWTGDKNGR